TLRGSELEAPAARRVSWIPGLAFTPTLDGDVLVWSQLVGAERRLAGLRWGGNATLLTLAGPNVLDTEPQAADGRVAWRSETRTAPASDPSSRSMGQRIMAAELRVGLLQGRNLTQPGPHDAPTIGGPWVGWREEGDAPGFVALNLATGALQRMPAPVRSAMLSATHVVVVPADGSPMQARAWSDASGKAWAPGPAAPLSLALLLAAALARRK
ncbi:MAG TPA: hypothetical protein VHI93_00175, partial [Candidatus Thermoplasmatota archaeon]|nr:hypothetical protein [Candidatus Thermoplasmatota archaeon]